VDHRARTVRQACAGFALLMSLVACSTRSATPSSVGNPSISRNAATSAAPATSQGPTPMTAGSDLVAADAPMPASGVCARAVGALVVVTANPDTPTPRCVIVTGGQHLLVRNASHQFGQTGGTITVSFAGFAPRQVAVGATTTFDQDFGGYLAPGVYHLQISLYSAAAEIWLR
jgi:hypothetical protein